jgi:hypothetical protein
MNKSKTTIRYHVQASISGGAWHDVYPEGFALPKQAERKFNLIIRENFPMWRGLTICWKIVRRRQTVTTDTEIVVHSTPSHGKKRILLGEMLVPSWLPEREKRRLKMRRIPGAPEEYQPQSQQPEP